jgi:hypothetical protein
MSSVKHTLLTASCKSYVWNGKQHCSCRFSCPAFSVSAACDSAASTIAHAVEMHFNLPYRTTFGQSMSIVGSTEDLGAWDVSTRVPMEWCDGDVWKAKVVADGGSSVEYKYVLVEMDGKVSQWKPGGNFEVNVEGFTGKVNIEDTWDGLHEVSTSGTWNQSPPLPISSSDEERASSLAVADASSSGEFDDVLKAALKHTFRELQETLETSLELADGAEPDDPRLLRNDQKLAAVHRKASSLWKAIDAGAPPPAYILNEIEKNDSSGPDA